MALERCNACNGRKVLVGLGMIEKKCENCKGIGWLESKEDEPKEILKIKKKPGRKKKAK